MPYKLNVNNKIRSVDAPAEMPLLWALRDVLDLKGAKYGCGIGVCGACTVIVGGKVTRSCMTHVGSVGSDPIMTVEGLAEAERHPVLEAWEALYVPQCGYCQPGQIMAATALLEQTPQPSDADIDAHMSGNLCRCGTYPRIREAIHHAAGAALAK